MYSIVLLSLITIFSNISQAVEVPFQTEIETCVPKSVLWGEIEKAMVDSQQTTLWPNNSSRSVGEGVFNGASITVTYFTGLSSPEYSYKLKNVRRSRSESRLTYEASPENHPFQGGAEIIVKDRGQTRTLSWIGNYQTDSSAWFQRMFFRRFSTVFFRRLSANVKKMETQHCQ